MSGGILLVLVAYAIVVAVIGAALYLAVRFAIRDGMRGHRLWLESTGRIGHDGPTGPR